MRYGILGGGFGLYGYLAAILERGGAQVCTLERYRERLRGRDDLRRYEPDVKFESDVESLISRCDALVIALRPRDQEAVLQDLLNRGWKRMLILEKPVASSPQRAIELLQRLIDSGITFRIGFTLGMTNWSERLGDFFTASAALPAHVDIRWLFCAHHYANKLDTWKRYTSEGGGAMRFFGIHLIALLSKFAQWSAVNCARSTDQRGEEPECRFTVSNGPAIASIWCNTRWSASPVFDVVGSAGPNVSFTATMREPLSENERCNPPSDQLDRRLIHLQKILDTLGADSTAEYQTYIRHAKLWNDLENLAQTAAGAHHPA